MDKFDNLLVCLDLTEMNHFLIKYANFLVSKISPKKIYFLHLLQTYDLPDDILDDMPEMEKSLAEIIREDLEGKIEREFEPVNGLEVFVHVEEGIKSDTLLQFTRDKKINLTIFGKKVGYSGAGSLPRRVAPLTPSSVLLVNTASEPKLDNLLVRNDFSKMSEIAMETATMLAAQTGANVSSFHAYKIPISHFPQYSAEDEKRLKEKMTKHGIKEYGRFMKKLKLSTDDIPCTYVYDRKYNEAHLLYHHGLVNNIDLILIGSKIKSELANIILDRTSEDLADSEKNINVLIVKDRKQTLGFMEALFK
ncbi:Nucleotide-binding universal stress protein, UspA family [Saccharicrinis carchari]|uniref:Nucleotide-binding universal stress protein, UspA family n=1 Tax=Saccharicrinis carchari TaxID=1168039 RepID=A0A521E815_SACCC|nr:universal stress protein [Saccharicrinis carchari]SMO80095.1 Nucleotide-binding universal stress protein, UspA family [Saccharicrinis carchari]